MPVTEELAANDVRVEADRLQVFIVVLLAVRRSAALAFVHSRRRVAYDVHL